MTAEQERAAVVAWLREQAKGRWKAASNSRWDVVAKLLESDAETVERLADAIEQGQHIKETSDAD